MSTTIRFAVVLMTESGEQTLVATATSAYLPDAHADDNRASVTLIIP
jgi:hypothetical protein